MRCHLSLSRGPRRTGGVTPLALLCLSLLLGVVALAVDGGTLMEDRRHVQATADAAALAAAVDLFANYASNQGIDSAGTAQASALSIAAANGFNNDGVQSIVTVNFSPQNYQRGPNAGQPLPPGYVEVIVQYNAGRLFSGIFGSGAIPVRGRAVARGQWLPINVNVIVLNLDNPAVLDTVGNGGLLIQGGLQVNSNAPRAISFGGNAVLSASSINLNQGDGKKGGGIGGKLFQDLLTFLLGGSGSTPTITTSGAIADPLRFLPAPDPAQLGLTTQGPIPAIKNGTQDLYPGVYPGGISVSGSATVRLHANSDGSPGIYYLQGGGFSTGNSASVVMAADASAGIMIYNDWQSNGPGSLQFLGSGPLTVTPPISGVYKGISLFQQRGTPSKMGPNILLAGYGNASLTGTIYAAYAAVDLSGHAGTNVLGGQIIADSVHISGRAAVSVSPLGQPIAYSRNLGLVE